MYSTPRAKPLTDAEVEELVYGRQVETVPLGRTATRAIEKNPTHFHRDGWRTCEPARLTEAH